MHFQHSPQIRSDFPELAAGVVFARGITPDAVPDLDRFTAVAKERLAAGTEADLPEIQAWRRAFSKMGLKPTQYRCASESLLRRFRKEGALPRIHPLIDLCNAISLAYAIPVGVFDLAYVSRSLEVRHADGDETYVTFGGEVERPDPGEVIFADAERRAHARRWTNRQSGHSAVRDTTDAVLIVAEAMHATAAADVKELTTVLAHELERTWPAVREVSVESRWRTPPSA
ncbi:B3/B4 domain-containing protein [Nonomuraea africana]|uniref:DNA/RNA-binding domain of Phe-tRNA-synthetase-like protein n=1 Tax=Nonomuraea africana TaxID=46171 RepID=A0ABR9K9C5_9ACTN|nr:phenylalanine--tRNA ligase beta subunit-related protein [Nonomuraea africana]MBE1558435.1 DNA/RNA-binding domain of Phe-tRNA-synthetase-like protein [Nonomuraea africana]